LISIRNETHDDHEAIRTLTIAAFANSELGHNGEADLVVALRASPNLLSLVACSDEGIVGHILFTPVTIRTPQREIHGMGLAPMSVLPRYQRTGIGTSLVTHGLDQLSADGCPFFVVLGHPTYYPRFGFLAASQYGVTHGFSGIPQDVFFIRCLQNDLLGNMLGGLAYYHAAFGPQHEGA
jgi:predicted N-acetyltransferase YhbS